MNRRRLLLVLGLIGAITVAGCVQSGAAYETHPVETWKALHDRTPGAFLLDVRTPQEFADGHIANATLIPYTQVTARGDELPEDKTTPIFVYCRSGRRSAIAAEDLTDMGYTEVHSLQGGIIEWLNAGYPLVRGA